MGLDGEVINSLATIHLKTQRDGLIGMDSSNCPTNFLVPCSDVRHSKHRDFVLFTSRSISGYTATGLMIKEIVVVVVRIVISSHLGR